MGALSIKTPATLKPVALDDAKAHARVVSASEDSLISALIDSATQEAEQLMQRAIMPQQWRWVMDAFETDGDNRISIPTPARAVSAVNYVSDSDGSTVILTPTTDYLADVRSDLYALVFPAYGKSWPSPRVQPGAVEIVIDVGWPDAASVPQVVKSWILMRVAALFDNRAAWTSGEAIFRNQFVDRLLDRWAVAGV